MKLDAPLQIKLTKNMRDKFKEVASSNSHNQSDLIRKWIENYIKENEHAENKNR